MNIFKSYIVSYKTYENYINYYNNNKIDKFDRIDVAGIYPPMNKVNEIFDKNIDELNFQFLKRKSKVFDHIDYRYIFKSNNDNEYVVDFLKLYEDNKNLKDIRLHDKIFISVSFSLNNISDDIYNEQTFKNEQYDVFSRIKFILNDYKLKYLKDNEIFMFGKPIDERRYNMYKYFIRICFKDYNIIKYHTSYFENNIGIYLI